MSALFPALKAMGEGCGAKLFYLTARNTTQAAAEDAVARLRAAQPGLALRSVTLIAKEKACLTRTPKGTPPVCRRCAPLPTAITTAARMRWRLCWTAAAVSAVPRWRTPPGSSRCAPLSWGWI